MTALDQAVEKTGCNIGVSVARGVVTLTGHVTTPEQKAATERVVAAVRGVRAIAEGVHVVGQPMQPLSDPTIARAIVAALDTIPDGPDVLARVENGWVTLTGTASAATYERVEQVLECVSGVRGVTSEIVVTTGAGIPGR